MLWGWLLLGLLGSAMLSPHTVRAQAATNAIQIRSLGPDRIEARPGQTITLRFRIRNRSDAAYEVEPTLDLPRGWRALSAVSPVSLGPSEESLQLISVSVPPGAPPGNKSLLFRGTVAGQPSLRDEASVAARVSSVQEARFRVVDAPRQVSAGTPYETVFSLTNAGNETVRFDLTVESDRSWPVRVRPRSDSLAPQETRRIRAVVETEEVPEAFDHRLRLRVRLQPWGITRMERTRAAVLPRGGAGEGLFAGPTYPGTLRLEAFGQAGEQGGQVTFDGSADLTADGSHALDLLLRTPNQSQTARFGRRSAYRATYTTPSWTLRAGDHTFQRTRLSSRGQRGLGVEARYTEARWQAGAYALRTRFGRAVRQGAAYARYDLHPRARIGANVVRTGGPFETGTLGTLRGVFVPWDDAELAVEGGLGVGDRGRDAAYSATLRGDPPWGRYRAQRLRVGGAFPNALSDRRSTSASVSAQPTDRFSISGNVRRSVRERIDDESFVSNAARAGLQVQGNGEATTWSLRAGGSIQRRPLRDEEAMRVRGRLRTGPLGLRPSVEVGRVRVGEETDLSFRTYGLDASLSLGGQQFDGRVALTDAPFSKGFARRSRLRATLSSRTQLGGRASVTLRGTLRSPGGDRAVTRSLQGSARYRLPFGHTIDAEARYRTGQDRGPRVRLAYAVPVGIPTPAFSADRATLNGRVVEFETNAPVPGVRVQLGAARRLTDDEGRFAVPVSEGTSYLRLSGLKRGRVPMLDLPRPIRPEEMNADLVIPVSAGASLIVRMVSYGYATTRAAARGADPVPKGGLAAEVVDVTDGRGGVRRRTGPDGRARFDNLRPGTWTVEPAGLQVPSDKAIEKPVYEADLAPGEADTLTVRVLPTERPEIQFEDGGQLELDDEEPEGQADSGGVPPEDSGAVPPEDLGDVPSETASPAAQVVPFKVGLGPFAGEVGPFEAWRGALRAAEQVRASGYRAGISAVDEEGRARYRIWAGQYGRRASARDALESLRTHFPDFRVARPSPLGEGYSVQIGAFTDWANAIRSSRDARDDGFSVFVSPIEWNGSRLYRVWVGRYGDQSTAEQERDTLARQFGTAHVIRTTPPGRYAVQLGAFSQLKLARRLAWRVLRDGEKAFIQSNEKGDETRYTVLVGAFTDRSEAEARAEDLSMYAPDAFVVQPR